MFVFFDYIEYLHLQGNRLEGDISFLCDEGDFLFPHMLYFFADCFGEVICPCCNGCCDMQNQCEVV
jgi:hypothetical protein